MLKVLTSFILFFNLSLAHSQSSSDYEIFQPNLAKFQSVGYPQFLRENPNLDIVFSVPYFYGFLNRVGSGVHIGNGYILTCRHVYAITDLKLEKEEFLGSKKIRQGLLEGNDLLLKQLPVPTEADKKVISGAPSTWSDVHLYNDWALLHDASFKGRGAFTKIRNVNTLKEGEPLWVIGRPFGNPPVQIAVGNFSKNLGMASLIRDIDLRPGFSGGPVVDSNGNLIGIINTFNQATREATFMNVDLIQTQIKPKKSSKTNSTRRTSATCRKIFS